MPSNLFLLATCFVTTCQYVVADDLLFEKEFKAQSSLIQVNFGTAIIENRNVGRVHVWHQADETVKILGSTCGCSIPRIEAINDQQTDMIVELRSGFPRDVSSNVKFSVGDGATKTIEITGKLVSGIRVNPAIALFDETGRVNSLDVHWDSSLVKSPVIEIYDARFLVGSLERLPEGLRFSLEPTSHFRLQEVGYLGQISFALKEGEKEFRFDIPVRPKAAVSPIIPRKIVLDPDSQENFRLVALISKDHLATEFSLVFNNESGENALSIESIQPREKSTILVIKISKELLKQLSDHSVVEAELRYKAPSTKHWKSFGFVTFVSILGEKK